MALPTYASPLERVWYYTYLVICGLVFLFLIAPILIVIPLSFNAEPYFTLTPKMLSYDPEGYSMRWYDTLLTLGHPAPETPRDSTWWSAVWERATWVQAAKNSFWVGLWATILATVLGTIAALGLSAAPALAPPAMSMLTRIGLTGSNPPKMKNWICWIRLSKWRIIPGYLARF